MPGTAALSSIRHTVHDSPIGRLTLVRDGDGLTGLYFPGHWTRPDRSTWGARVNASDDRGFDRAIAQLDEYFAGRRRAFDLPLSPAGSAAARHVWALLREIPYGRTTTYGALAERIGGGISAPAVGEFVGSNPLSILIPCHRVVGATGKLVGYAGGLVRKRFLLELEQAIPAGLW